MATASAFDNSRWRFKSALSNADADTFFRHRNAQALLDLT
jgi:hypothetical protein